MSLFQRIRTPFSDAAEADQPPPRPRSRAIGELLRARREQLELDLDPIGEALRIKPSYLAALEQGRTEDLPGPAYAMGFVRAYANHLGLDGDRVLARYKADTADVHNRPDLSLPVPLGERSLPGGPILLVALILALCGYGTWYYLSTGERTRPERVAAVPAELREAPAPNAAAPAAPAMQSSTTSTPMPPADIDAPKPPPALVAGGNLRSPAEPASPDPPSASPAATVPTPTLSSTRPGGGASEPIVFPGSAPAQPTAAAPQSAAPPPPMPGALASAKPAQAPLSPPAAAPAAAPPTAAPPTAAPPTAASPTAAATIPDGRVAIRALADCWIQVRAADQAIVFSRVLKAGETYHVPGRTGLSLRTGNAGALAIEVDGKQAPSIGSIGTLRRNIGLDPDALAAGTAVHG